MNELPVVCTLGPAALKARREGLLANLVRRADAHEELPDGHRLRFCCLRRHTRADSPRYRRGAPVLSIPPLPSHR